MGALSKKEHISCVLIGGFAINFYNVTRQTADVDFLITQDDFDKIKKQLQEHGYKEDTVEKVFARYKSDAMKLMDLDFMFIGKETLDKMIKEGKEITIAGQKFLVPSLLHLIALKLHSIKYNPELRVLKDLPDIMSLIKENNLDIKSTEFKEICLKYGTEELYRKIINFF